MRGRNLEGPSPFFFLHASSFLERDMAMQRDFMGRIFLKPLGQSVGQNAELYINVGWNTTGGQLVPPYDARLAVACSEEEFNATMQELKAVFLWRF